MLHHGGLHGYTDKVAQFLEHKMNIIPKAVFLDVIKT
jgi:hypothetical protein